jgi:hypothetical protein
MELLLGHDQARADEREALCAELGIIALPRPGAPTDAVRPSG